MNAITHHIANPTEPDLSPALAAELDRIERPHPDISTPKQFPEPVKREAETAVDALEILCRPVSTEAVRQWIRPIGAAVRNPPSAEDFAAWGAALMVACGDLAAGAFSPATQREALRTFQFFPAVADVSAIVGPRSHALRGRLRALRKIAGAEVAALLPTPPTEAEKAAVATIVAGLGPRVVAEPEGLHRAPHPPLRTVEEQLRILAGDAA